MGKDDRPPPNTVLIIIAVVWVMWFLHECTGPDHLSPEDRREVQYQKERFN